jgi:ferredoxin
MPYFRVNAKCDGCLACVQNCPANALKADDSGASRTLSHNMARCARCGNCWRVCPQNAIEFQHFLHGQWDEVTTLTLLRCRICDEPLYTADFRENAAALADKDVEPLCPRHREALPSIMQAHFFPAGKIPQEEAQ